MAPTPRIGQDWLPGWPDVFVIVRTNRDQVIDCQNGGAAVDLGDPTTGGRIRDPFVVTMPPTRVGGRPAGHRRVPTAGFLRTAYRSRWGAGLVSVGVMADRLGSHSIGGPGESAALRMVACSPMPPQLRTNTYSIPSVGGR